MAKKRTAKRTTAARGSGPKKTTTKTTKKSTKKTSKAARKSTRRKPPGAAKGGKTGRDRPGGALAKASIAALQAELARRLADLHRERDTLLAQLDALDAEIASCNGAVTVAVTGAATAGRGRTRKRVAGAGGRRPRNKTTLVTALEKLLTKRTMGVSEMADAVQKAGYRTSSPNFRTIVNQTLIQNDKVFKRVSRGQYTAR